jgi:hypothetical protein
LGQGRKGGDEEYAADEDGPDTTDHQQDYGTDVAAQNSEAHFDHQVLHGLLVSCCYYWFNPINDGYSDDELHRLRMAPMTRVE